jgi:Transposase
MQIARIGLDLAKYVFEIFCVDAHGRTVLRKTLRRHAVLPFFANLPTCLVGMEASNGAHFWAKAISELGHEVRLISPQFVTPYVKSNKNDRNDAEAICEAVGRPNMRFVPIKSPNSWRCKRFIGSVVAWSLIGSGSSIRSAVFSGSRASSLQRTLAICGGPSRGSLATTSTALSTPWFAR